MAFEPIKIADELKQAFWRLALNGNPHWCKYNSSAGQPSGTNDKPASLGHVAKDGRDTCDKAAKPYFYTTDVVDQYQLGFGFWSRSVADKPTYRFAAFDIEPMVQSPTRHVNRNPSPAEVRATFQDAVEITKAAINLAKTRHDILWVLLVQTSESHFHTWAIFDEPVLQAVHADFVDSVLEQAGPIQNLDKSTNRAKQGFGDVFRAPWSWKRQRRSEALFSYLPDQELVLRLAREAQPPASSGSRLVCARSNSGSGRLLMPVRASEANGSEEKNSDAYAGQPEIFNQHLEILRRDFEILGPGMRNLVQAKVVARLVNKGFDDAAIVRLGSAWLESYRANIGTPLPEAIELLKRCLVQTRANPKFATRQPHTNYELLHRSAMLTAADELFLSGQIIQRDGRPLLLLPAVPTS